MISIVVVVAGPSKELSDSGDDRERNAHVHGKNAAAFSSFLCAGSMHCLFMQCASIEKKGSSVCIFVSLMLKT